MYENTRRKSFVSIIFTFCCYQILRTKSNILNQTRNFQSRHKQSVKCFKLYINFRHFEDYGKWLEYILFFRAIFGGAVTVPPSFDKMGGWKKVLSKLNFFTKKSKSSTRSPDVIIESCSKELTTEGDFTDFNKKLRIFS